MKNYLLSLSLSLILILLTSCGKSPPKATGGWQDYPSPPPPETGLPAKRPKTKVLTQFASASIKSMSDGAIVLDAAKKAPVRSQNELGTMKVDEPDQLEAGTIIVSAPTAEAPSGFMLEISNIEYDANGDAVIQTTQATLAEVIAGADLTPEQLESTTQSIKVPMMLKMEDVPGQLTPQWVLLPYDSGEQCVKTPSDLAGGNVKAQACVQVAFWIDVRVDIGWNWIFPYLAGFGATANGFVDVLASAKASASAGASANGGTTIGTTVKLADINTSATLKASSGGVTFWLGPIPVVIVPSLELTAGTRGGISFNASASASAQTTIPDFWIPLGTPNNPVSFGFYCNSNFTCNKINTFPESMDVATYLFENWRFPSNPVSLNAAASVGVNVDLKAYAILSASASLYGVAGLSAGLDAYVGPEASFTSSVTATSNLSTVTLSPVKTRLSAGIYAGMDGFLTAGINIFGWQPKAELYRGSIIPRTQLGGITPMCWEGTTLLAKCP